MNTTVPEDSTYVHLSRLLPDISPDQISSSVLSADLLLAPRTLSLSFFLCLFSFSLKLIVLFSECLKSNHLYYCNVTVSGVMACALTEHTLGLTVIVTSSANDSSYCCMCIVYSALLDTLLYLLYEVMCQFLHAIDCCLEITSSFYI